MPQTKLIFVQSSTREEGARDLFVQSDTMLCTGCKVDGEEGTPYHIVMTDNKYQVGGGVLKSKEQAVTLGQEMERLGYPVLWLHPAEDPDADCWVRADRILKIHEQHPEDSEEEEGYFDGTGITVGLDLHLMGGPKPDGILVKESMAYVSEQANLLLAEH